MLTISLMLTTVANLAKASEANSENATSAVSEAASSTPEDTNKKTAIKDNNTPETPEKLKKVEESKALETASKQDTPLSEKQTDKAQGPANSDNADKDLAANALVEGKAANADKSLDKGDPTTGKEIAVRANAAPKEEGKPAGKGEESTEKIGIAFGKIETNSAGKNNFVELDKEWYMQQVIPAAVDLQVSGNNFKVANSKLVIKVEKKDIINSKNKNDAAVNFSDSQKAQKIQRSQDKEYYICEYSFEKIVGGERITLPFFFAFNGHFAKNNDKIKAYAYLYNAENKELAKAEFEFTAKSLPLQAQTLPYMNSSWTNFEYHPQYSQGKVEPDAFGSQHEITTYAAVNSENDEYTLQDKEYYSEIAMRIFTKSDDKVLPEGIGVVYPKSIKVKMTCSAGVTFATNGHFAVRGGEYRKDSYKLAKNKQELEFIIDKPDFSNNSWDNVNSVKVFAAAVFKHVKVKQDYKIKVQFLADYVGNDNYSEIATCIEKYTISPLPFTRKGNFSYYKRAFSEYYISNEYVYIYNPEYYYLDKERVYKGQHNIFEKGGVPICTFLENSNNGSGYGNASGGNTTKIDAIYSKLESDAVYFNSVNLDIRGNNATKVKTEIEQAIKAGKVSLWGVKAADNSEEEITKFNNNTLIDSYYEIKDTQRKYNELILKFADGITLDNVVLRFREKVWFVEKEIDKLNKLKKGESSVKYESKASVSVFDTQENKYIKQEYHGVHNEKTNNNNLAYFKIERLKIVIDEYVPKEQSIVYQKDGDVAKTFDYKVGPELPAFRHDNVTYGNFTQISDVKSITLLPDGFEYAGEFAKDTSEEKAKLCWADNSAPKVTVEVKENYQASGKTAIIVNYGDLKIEKSYPLLLKIRPTSSAQAGEHLFENYLIYDNNDVFYPKNDYKYIDTLDLDNDSNKKEVFIKKTAKVNYTPAFEAILTNAVAEGNEDAAEQGKLSFANLVTADLSGACNLKIKLFNNMVSAIQSLTILDVLPHVNDHSIVEKFDAKTNTTTYPERGSKFAITLTKKLEDANKNSKFDFYYQLAEQGNDLNSVKDGEWKKAADIQDISAVKSIKAVLKAGQTIQNKETVEIILPCVLPKNTQLNEKSDFAYNSSAFSTNGVTFNEGNKVTIGFATYKVKGTVFLDLNENGVMDNNEPPVKDVSVKLYKKNTSSQTSASNRGNNANQVRSVDGGEGASNTAAVTNNLSGFDHAKDLNGEVYEAKTNDSGQYEFNVFTRGKYTAEFTLKSGQKFCTSQTASSSSTNESVSNDILEGKVSTTKDNESAVTEEGLLNPKEREIIRNAAITMVWKIKLLKKDKQDKTKLLKGAEFKLWQVKVNEAPNSGTANNDNNSASNNSIRETTSSVSTVVNTSDSRNDNAQQSKDRTKKYNNLTLVEATYKDADNKESTANLQTNEKGELEFKDLKYGSGEYYVEEVKAPEGYELSQQPESEKLKRVKLTTDNQEVKLEVLNEKLTPTTPTITSPDIPYIPSEEPAPTTYKVGVVTKTGEAKGALTSVFSLALLALGIKATHRRNKS